MKMVIVWVVADNSDREVAVFNYKDKSLADARAVELTKIAKATSVSGKRYTHYVKPMKVMQ